jgi:hypothetical protein
MDKKYYKQHNENRRNLYQQRLSQNRCTGCGRSPKQGFTKCAMHLAIGCKHSKLYRERIRMEDIEVTHLEDIGKVRLKVHTPKDVVPDLILDYSGVRSLIDKLIAVLPEGLTR